MSSVSTQTCGFLTRTSVSALSSAREYAAPVGFDGELRSTHLVFGVIAAANASAVSLKPLFSEQGTQTGSPSASNTISGYDTQYGAGMMTSSPGLSVAMKALYRTCLPPVPTVIWFGL